MLRTVARSIAVIGGLVALAAVAKPAAADLYEQQHAVSKSPYWRVGAFNKQLSEACRRREFGQLRQYRYTIGYVGEKGPGITGIANTEFNLYDPKGLAQKGFTYHIFDEGYSDCRVYLAKPKPKRQQ